MMDKDRELLDPRVIAAAGALGMTVMQDGETKAEMNLSLLAMLGIEEAPKGQIYSTEICPRGASDQS
jgi:hypothetical protein